VLSVDIIAASCLLLHPSGESVLDYIRGVVQLDWIPSGDTTNPFPYLIGVIIAFAGVILLIGDYYLSWRETSGCYCILSLITAVQ
jgi:hypothetical protein